MAELVLGIADECIYCGDTLARRSREHVIAASLGGNLIIESASCPICADLTSAIEGGVARRVYHVARAYYQLPTRRPQKYPKSVEIEVFLGKYGPKKQVSVPLSEAPISVIAPKYTHDPTLDENGRLWSLSVLEVKTLDVTNVQSKLDAILRKHQGVKVKFVTLPLKINQDFERVLWKSAYGFFWQSDRASLAASSAKDFVLGVVEPHKVHSDNFYVQDVYSENRDRSDEFPVSASVFSKPEDDHSHLYCELNFFAKLGLPLYTCRIPNVSGVEFARVRYAK